jgi:hypothetical protein
MVAHAIAMVRWSTFRPGRGAGGAAAFDYGSDQARLLDRVGDGGTLWLVTSRRRGRSPRRYHLAYKLVDCAPVPPEDSTFSSRWEYVVRARDWRASRHFGLNDATSTLRRLRFTTGRPMAEVTNLGLRLLGIPGLTDEDVALLDRLQHHIEHARAAFVSYAHADAALAATIEAELERRDVSVSRDVALLRPGEEWAAALEREVTGTDAFVVLVSPAAAASEWVRREVAWALAEHDRGGLVRAIVPVVLPGGGWEEFPELHRFQRWDHPTSAPRDVAFDALAAGIVATRS